MVNTTTTRFIKLGYGGGEGWMWVCLSCGERYCSCCNDRCPKCGSTKVHFTDQSTGNDEELIKDLKRVWYKPKDKLLDLDVLSDICGYFYWRDDGENGCHHVDKLREFRELLMRLQQADDENLALIQLCVKFNTLFPEARTDTRKALWQFPKDPACLNAPECQSAVPCDKCEFREPVKLRERNLSRINGTQNGVKQ